MTTPTTTKEKNEEATLVKRLPDANNVHCLVIGGCGFLGKSLVSLLLVRGYKVRVMDITWNCFEGNKDVEYIFGDLCSFEDCFKACQGIQRVFHLASPNPLKLDRFLFKKINIDGTRTVVEACKKAGVPELVYTSSASVVFSTRSIFGSNEDEPYALPNPDAYCESKAEAEKIVLNANNCCSDSRPNLRTVAIRPHGIFGEGDPGVIQGLNEAGKKKKNYDL